MKKYKNLLSELQKFELNKYMKKINFKEGYLGDINIDIPFKFIKHVNIR